MDERVERLLQATKSNPLLAKVIGDPSDPDNPRMKTPLQRAEEGMSRDEQFDNLVLDIEMLTMSIANLITQNESLAFQLDKLQNWAAQKMAEDFTRKVKEDPEGAVKDLQNLLGGFDLGKESVTSSYGPMDNSPDAGIKYAGSVQEYETRKPDNLIETPNGWIKVEDIPGYRDDPNWTPSPDWVDANCMCPAHKARRAAAEGKHPGDGDYGTGLYL